MKLRRVSRCCCCFEFRTFASAVSDRRTGPGKRVVRRGAPSPSVRGWATSRRSTKCQARGAVRGTQRPRCLERFLLCSPRYFVTGFLMDTLFIARVCVSRLWTQHLAGFACRCALPCHLRVCLCKLGAFHQFGVQLVHPSLAVSSVLRLMQPMGLRLDVGTNKALGWVFWRTGFPPKRIPKRRSPPDPQAVGGNAQGKCRAFFSMIGPFGKVAFKGCCLQGGKASGGSLQWC